MDKSLHAVSIDPATVPLVQTALGITLTQMLHHSICLHCIPAKQCHSLASRCQAYPARQEHSQTSSCDVFCVPLQALKMLADYQQTTRRPMQSTMQSTRSGVLSQRIVAFKSDKASPNPSGVSHGVEGLAIPSIGPFVSGSDGNLQEASTIGTCYSHAYCHCMLFCSTG